MNVVNLRDGPVAVHGDGKQVEDGRSAAKHVRHGPHLAQLRAECPLFANLEINVKEREKELIGMLENFN